MQFNQRVFMGRKIKQITSLGNTTDLIALCDDNTLWGINLGQDEKIWKIIPEIPEEKYILVPDTFINEQENKND